MASSSLALRLLNLISRDSRKFFRVYGLHLLQYCNTDHRYKLAAGMGEIEILGLSTKLD